MNIKNRFVTGSGESSTVYYTKREIYHIVRNFTLPKELMSEYDQLASYTKKMIFDSHWRDTPAVQLKLNSIENDLKITLDEVFANLLYSCDGQSADNIYKITEEVLVQNVVQEMEKNYVPISINKHGEFHVKPVFYEAFQNYQNIFKSALQINNDSELGQKIDSLFLNLNENL
jgi:hypothetical protein